VVRIHGHRGCRSLLPENSIEGVKAAFAYGAFAVEIDVRLTKDLDFAVVHDEKLQSSYYQIGHPIEVAKTGINELKNISFGQAPLLLFPDQKKMVTHIPSLSDLIAKFNGAQHRFNLEVKVNEDTENLTAEAFSMWIEREEYQPFRVQSFNLEFLERLDESNPEIEKHWLIDKKEDLNQIWPEWLSGLAVEASLITNEWIAKINTAKLELSAWTVNSIVEAELLIAKGIQEIITDNPKMLIETFKKID
jgi:glycerophosphoryl diester phosphodiesterase